MKKKILLLIFTAILFHNSPSIAQNSGEQKFFQTLNDVPLMPGLYEILNESMIFDKPEGRIIEVVAATGDLKSEEIRLFYRQVLPQMGWVHMSPDSYVRLEERLTLRIERQNDYNVARFTVAPR